MACAGGKEPRLDSRLNEDAVRAEEASRSLLGRKNNNCGGINRDGENKRKRGVHETAEPGTRGGRQFELSFAKPRD